MKLQDMNQHPIEGEKMTGALKLENGGTLLPESQHVVRCLVHGTVTTWGALDPIQQLAVEEGIDTMDDLPCLLLPTRHERTSD